MYLMRFGKDEKIRALQREIALRKSVYAKRVRQKTMLQSTADFEIGIMEHILLDYLGVKTDDARQ